MEYSQRFQFKNFSVAQDQQVFKVNTDALLLASWIDDMSPQSQILEIGSGTGVISLCLADKFRNEKPNITAIDIDSKAYQLTHYNFNQSKFESLKAIHTDLVTHTDITEKYFYDLIVSNPPFYEEQNPSSKLRNVNAKYTSSLPFATLIKSSRKLIKLDGRIALIIPFHQLENLVELAKKSIYI